MSIPVPLLLTFLALSACQGHAASLLQTSNLLKESILLLNLLETKVSCDKMNVTNIFAGDKSDDDVEILCKATAVAWQSRSCHTHLEGVYLNLLALLQMKSTAYKEPCPVAGDDTTALKYFLGDLRRFLQRLMKNN